MIACYFVVCGNNLGAINIVTLFLVLNVSNTNKVTVNIAGIDVSYCNHELNKNAYHFTKFTSVNTIKYKSPE